MPALEAKELRKANVLLHTTELRTVPTFATAHTFCASRDGPRKSGFLTVVPAKTGIFLRSFNLGIKFHTLFCILALSRIIVAKLSLKKCVVTSKFLFGFQ